MANFSPTNYESPTTGVKLRWGKPPAKGEANEWHPDVVDLYLTIKNNEFSEFFYQTDVQMIRLLCLHHTKALRNPDTTAAEMKAVYEQWDKFGITMRSRANIRYTQTKTAAEENYSAGFEDFVLDAFKDDKPKEPIQVNVTMQEGKQ
jgi:hypothetical protein